MKKYIVKTVMISTFVVLAFTGCGGGSKSAPVNKSVAKVYLFGNMSSPASFGNMSSSGRIVTVRTSIAIPTAEVMVNYSSAPGATSGLCVTRANALPGDSCILRDGVISPSGSVLLPASAFDGSTYNIGSKTLTISMRNNGMQPLKITSSGNGTEFATIILTLVNAGVIPTTMPEVDLAPKIGEDLPDGSTAFLPGRKTNFLTTYH
jgi:hypothetical protein